MPSSRRWRRARGEAAQASSAGQGVPPSSSPDAPARTCSYEGTDTVARQVRYGTPADDAARDFERGYRQQLQLPHARARPDRRGGVGRGDRARRMPSARRRPSRSGSRARAADSPRTVRDVRAAAQAITTPRVTGAKACAPATASPDRRSSPRATPPPSSSRDWRGASDATLDHLVLERVVAAQRVRA